MDSLFIMQRYWGSDEESEEEKDTSSFCSSSNEVKLSKKRPKVETLVIDEDCDEGNNLYTKKQKLHLSESILQNGGNMEHGSDLYIVEDTKCPAASDFKIMTNNESLENEISFLNITNHRNNDISAEVTTKQKLKERNRKSVCMEDDGTGEIDDSYLSKNIQSSNYIFNETISVDQKLKSKSGKKSKSYMNDEIITLNCDSADLMDDCTASPEKKKGKISMNGEIGAENGDKFKMAKKQKVVNTDGEVKPLGNIKFDDVLVEIDESDVIVSHVKKKKKASLNGKVSVENVEESKITKQQKFRDTSYSRTNEEITPSENVKSDESSFFTSPKKKKSKTLVNGQTIVHDADTLDTTKKIKIKDENLDTSYEDTKFLARIKAEVSIENGESGSTVGTSSFVNKNKENTVEEGINVADKKALKLAKRQKHKDSVIKESEEMVFQENTELKIEKSENNDQVFCTIGKIYKQTNESVRHALPSWLSNPTYISINLQEKETPISELKYLDSNTKNNLKLAGINFLFPVQLAVIPWLMQSKQQSLMMRPSDICVSAPTGSGKTLAYVLPIVQSLKDRVVRAVRALVVLPVGELAIQVYKVFETFVQGTDLKVALLTGKKSFTAEQNVLVKSTNQSVLSLVDIVITTPGRIHDHIHQTKGFCLKRLKYLVIDEADRMMEDIQKGWLKQVEDAVFRSCSFPECVCSSYKRTFYEPTSAYNFGFVSQSLQKLLYSATLTHDPEILHSLSLYKPKLFTTSGSDALDRGFTGSCAIPSELKVSVAVCDEGLKPMAICHLIKSNNFKKVLCFTESVERAHRLHVVLEEMGLFQVREISSYNSVVKRKIVLEQFSSGKIDVLVCSDLVARGLDIDDVDCVISYDVPQYVKIYIHRIGRTARAGKTGVAITLLSEGEIPTFKKILKPAGMDMPEKIYISSEDLKHLANKFQQALSVADNKIKKEKQGTEKSKKHDRRQK